MRNVFFLSMEDTEFLGDVLMHFEPGYTACTNTGFLQGLLEAS